MKSVSKEKRPDVRRPIRFAKHRWPEQISELLASQLSDLVDKLRVSVPSGDVQLLDGKWYVTHPGLIRLARRNRCAGIHVEPAVSLSEPAAGRWAFKATVYKSRTCKGFAGYGDADPSNVSPLVHGAVIRAVNRASRVEYGIGFSPGSGSFSAGRDSLFRFARGMRLIPKCSKGHLEVVGDRALFSRRFLSELAFEFRGHAKI